MTWIPPEPQYWVAWDGKKFFLLETKKSDELIEAFYDKGIFMINLRYFDKEEAQDLLDKINAVDTDKMIAVLRDLPVWFFEDFKR